MTPPAAPLPRRLLVILPTWVGDAVMATPALAMLREALPGACIAGLMPPGIDDLIASAGLLDECHVAPRGGVMAPKRAAARVRGKRYDTALILTNSFSTALAARLALIPRRVGYDRDGRGVLLTESLTPPRRREVEPYKRSATAPNAWAPIPACRYYAALASHLLDRGGADVPAMPPMRLGIDERERAEADAVLARAGVDPASPGALAVLNPGGNRDAKRWPAKRFAELADHLARTHGMTVLINGAPAEAELVAEIAGLCGPGTRVVDLAACGNTLRALKGVVDRCALMVTNDTGPRHIAAAVRTPVVSLFGPTDPRWTEIPFDQEVVITADPTLPAEEVADDHAARCAIDRITVERVVEACDGLLARAPAVR